MKREVICQYPSTCKKLLRYGFRIVDIRPDRKQRNGTVFVFADETVNGLYVRDAMKQLQNDFERGNNDSIGNVRLPEVEL